MTRHIWKSKAAKDLQRGDVISVLIQDTSDEYSEYALPVSHTTILAGEIIVIYCFLEGGHQDACPVLRLSVGHNVPVAPDTVVPFLKITEHKYIK